MPELTSTSHPDPPELSEPPSGKTLDRLKADAATIPLAELVTIAKENGSAYGETGGRKALKDLYDGDAGQAAVALVFNDLAARKTAHEEAVHSMWPDGDGPLSMDEVEKVAADLGLDVKSSADFKEAAAIAGLDRQIARARIELAPVSSPHPWKDTTLLLPHDVGPPWSTEALERDRLRWETADLPAKFDADAWKLYAEQGRDLVGEEVARRLDDKIAELTSWRHRQIGMAEADAARQEALAEEGRKGRAVIESMGL